jgi:hypothetical protein
MRLSGGGITVLARRAVGRRRMYVAWGAVTDPDDLPMAQRFVRSLRPDPDDALFPLAPPDGVGAWGDVYLPHERCALEMPAPSVDALERVELRGQRAPGRRIEGRDANAIYRVRVVRPRSSDELRFDEVQAAYGLYGEITPTQVAGFAGRELRGPGGMTTRIFRAHDLWVVIEVEPSAADAPRAAEFLDSLRLL